jgi:hypothetical protein
MWFPSPFETVNLWIYYCLADLIPSAIWEALKISSFNASQNCCGSWIRFETLTYPHAIKFHRSVMEPTNKTS